MTRETPGLATALGSEFKRPRFYAIGALVILWSLYPVIFTLSHNWFTVTTRHVWFLLAVIPLASLIAYVLCGLFLKVLGWAWDYFRPTPLKRGDAFVASAVCVIVVFIYGLLHTPLRSIVDQDFWVIAFLIGFGGVIYLFLMKGKFFAMLLLSGGLVTTAGGEWAYNIFAEGGTIAEASAIAKRTGLDSGGKALDFDGTPNIYLLIYDGYGNDEALRTIYDVDNSAMYEYLNDKNFVVTRNSLANHHYTWATLLALLLADHHHFKITIGKDQTKVGRLILNGTAHNPVFDVLNHNGYKIQSINRGNYFGDEQGKIDFYFPSTNLWNAFDVFDSSRLEFLQIRLANKDKRWNRQKAMLDERVTFVAQDDSPWFTIAYIYEPGHSKRSKSWKRLKSYEKAYRRKLGVANTHIRHIVERIQTQDPGAFIILMGDHGGGRYNGVWKTKDTNDATTAIKANEIPVRTVTLDSFGILMAVETGGRCDEHVYDTLTPVNVMRMIFTCLSGEDLLANKPRDDAYFGHAYRAINYLTAESGVILDRWVPLTDQVLTHGSKGAP